MSEGSEDLVTGELRCVLKTALKSTKRLLLGKRDEREVEEIH